MNGLDWRGTYFSRFEPVASQGGVTVWTAGHETALKLAELDPNGLKAPRVTTASQAVAHFSDRPPARSPRA